MPHPRAPHAKYYRSYLPVSVSCWYSVLLPADSPWCCSERLKVGIVHDLSRRQEIPVVCGDEQCFNGVKHVGKAGSGQN